MKADELISIMPQLLQTEIEKNPSIQAMLQEGFPLTYILSDDQTLNMICKQMNSVEKAALRAIVSRLKKA